MAKSLSPSDICPMDLGINILSGKWKLRILWNIYNKKIIRFNELQKVLGNITTKTLTEQLRELEDKKIIKRTVYPEIPPKVELCEWGKEYMKSSK